MSSDGGALRCGDGGRLRFGSMYVVVPAVRGLLSRGRSPDAREFPPRPSPLVAETERSLLEELMTYTSDPTLRVQKTSRT